MLTAENVSNHVLMLGFSFFVFILSSLYMNEAGKVALCFNQMKQVSIFLLFGFLYSINLIKFKKDALLETSLLEHISLAVLYAAFFQVVLFPESGFGFLEWTFMIMILTADFFSYSMGKSKMKLIMFNPTQIIILGTILFFAKAFVFYMFPEDIYKNLIATNKTVQWILVVLFSIFVTTLFMKLLKVLKTKVQYEQNKNALQAVTKGVSKIFKTFAAFIMSTFISVLLAPLLLVGGIFLFFKIKNDIFHFIEFFLAPLLTTGKYSITPSSLYYALQISSMLCVLFFHFYSQRKQEKFLSEKLNKKVTDELKKGSLSDDEKKDIQEMIKQCTVKDKIYLINDNVKIKSKILDCMKEQKIYSVQQEKMEIEVNNSYIASDQSDSSNIKDNGAMLMNALNNTVFRFTKLVDDKAPLNINVIMQLEDTIDDLSEIDISDKWREKISRNKLYFETAMEQAKSLEGYTENTVVRLQAILDMFDKFGDTEKV